MEKDSGKNKFSELRKKAQAFLASKPEQAAQKTDGYSVDVRQLVHELETYQIELEMQNEDLRTTQQEFEKAHRRYTEFYDFAPIAFLTANEKGLILEANLTAGDMLGVMRGQLLNRRLSDFICPDDQDIFYLRWKKLVEMRQQQSYDLRLLRSDGALFHGQIDTTAHTTANDPPSQFRIIISDISIRKEAELAKIRRIKNRYRAIVMDQTELICRFDPQGRITFVNDAYCRHFGVNHQDILGTYFLPAVHQDDLPLVQDHFKNLTQFKPDKTIEHRVHLPDGKVHWQQWCGSAIYDKSGQAVEYQAVGRDITQLKEAEEKLRNEVRLRQLFMDALPCIALLLENHTRRIVASNKTAAAVGVTPGELCYTSWLHRKTPCPWCQAPNLWQNGAPRNAQFRNNDIYWDAYWVPVDENLYLHYAFDNTEKQKTKDALKKAHDELEKRVVERTLALEESHAQLLHSEKLAAIGNLSASIAHEFNNPLQGVMTIIKGILRYVPLEKKEEELIALALQECHRMKNLIADLRDFFRPSSDQPTRVNLHAALDALLLLSKKDFHTRDITVDKKFGDNIPPIMAVADQLKQVFLNLLNNAADACEGAGVITITTEACDADNVVVHIADNGTGISAENMAHIFEPFFTTKPNRKGTGLGLSVSYGIIKNHEGRIEVVSECNKGSRFSVFLPVEGIHHAERVK
jgi:PAS domain S-box-containing protein